jgi:hypothetical protein
VVRVHEIILCDMRRREGGMDIRKEHYKVSSPNWHLTLIICSYTARADDIQLDSSIVRTTNGCLVNMTYQLIVLI